VYICIYIYISLGENLTTYNCRISKSFRPAAAAPAFWRLARSWYCSWRSESLKVDGRAETEATAARAERTAVLKEGIFGTGVRSFLFDAMIVVKTRDERLNQPAGKEEKKRRY
jgi:hypothetical protein